LELVELAAQAILGVAAPIQFSLQLQPLAAVAERNLSKMESLVVLAVVLVTQAALVELEQL
jgi:hypothetical protein